VNAICAALARQGVEHVFGIPGTQNVTLFEALRISGLRTVLTTSELSAAFMANGYARASGRVGVVAAIPGPGFAYALPGIAEARLDSAPLLLLTGVPAREPGVRFQLQAIDQAAIAGPLVKGVFTVERPGDVARVIAQAVALAQSGEPGPVLVQLADEVLGATLDGPPPAVTPLPSSDAVAVGEGVELCRGARRPVILAGQGAANGAEALGRVLARWPALVVTTSSGRGVIAEDHPRALRFDVQGGGLEALNELLDASDLVLVLGAKLSHNGTAGFALRLPADRLVHVDAGAEVLGANYPVRLAVRAGVEQFLARMLEALPVTTGGGDWSTEDVTRWRERLRPTPPRDPPEPAMHGVEGGQPAAFFGALRRALPRGGILVTDSGLHQTLARRHFEVLAPRGLVIPSDFQAMGFGVPAGVGAKLAAPERPVVVVVGDGGFQMTGLELLTAVRERVPLTIIVFNDGQLNLIRLQQYREFGHAHAVELRNPDFSSLAAALGANYVRLEGDAEGTLRAAIAQDGPTLVEVLVGDSPAIRALRAKGLARETVRGVIGPRVARWLKRLLRRGA
jgi:acetolactate synthase I/II/III large subunit